MMGDSSFILEKVPLSGYTKPYLLATGVYSLFCQIDPEAKSISI
jgi:hypothetical protein